MKKSLENELETLLVKACEDEAQCYFFYEALIKSDIYFIPHENQKPLLSQQEHLADTSRPKQVGIMQITIEGEAYIPFFSSLEAVKKVISSERAYYRLNAPQFFRMIRDSKNVFPLILNPGCNHGKIFSINEIQLLSNGKNPADCKMAVASSGAQILLGQPSNYPAELVRVLIKAFKRHKNIKKGFLVQTFNPAVDDNPHLLIVIDVKKYFHHIAHIVGSLIVSVRETDCVVDIVRFSHSGCQVSKYCLEIKPFYKKKILGFF